MSNNTYVYIILHWSSTARCGASGATAVFRRLSGGGTHLMRKITFMSGSVAAAFAEGLAALSA